MKNLWVTLPSSAAPPRIYIIIHDREFDIKYISNLVSPDAKPQNHTIINNIITDNQTGIFFYQYVTNGQIAYNDVFDNSYKNYQDNFSAGSLLPSPGTGELSLDPLFADTDYHLGSTSPCIDTGHPGLEYNDGDGSRNDIGAYGGIGLSSGQTGFSGSGFVFTSLGKIPTSEITNDETNPSFGLVNVSEKIHTDYKIPQYTDSPLGGNLWLHGLFGDADDVDYYQILAGKWNGTNPPDADAYIPLNDTLTKVQYLVKTDGTVEHKYMSLGPNSISGINNVYQHTNSGWWSHLNLRLIWNTRLWENGKYTLTYKAYRRKPFILIETLEQVSPLSNTMDNITIVIDNTPVEAIINTVKYNSGVEIKECGIIKLSNDTENLKFDITARHSSKYLKDYALVVYYGKNKNGGLVVKDQYVGLHDSPPPQWEGVQDTVFNSITAPAGQLKPWMSCAYQFSLQVWARTTDGFHYINYAEFNDHYYLDVAPCVSCGP